MEKYICNSHADVLGALAFLRVCSSSLPPPSARAPLLLSLSLRQKMSIADRYGLSSNQSHQMYEARKRKVTLTILLALRFVRATKRSAGALLCVSCAPLEMCWYATRGETRKHTHAQNEKTMSAGESVADNSPSNEFRQPIDVCNRAEE